MKLDRDLQRAILQTLADAYPETPYDIHKRILTMGERLDVIGNLLYLSQHDLIVGGFQRALDGSFAPSGPLQITAHGLDFLADDGGLTAILGVVTIRLHDDTLKSLVEAKILASDLPQPDKKRWLDQLRSLPAETTKHLVLKLVDLGLTNAPAALAVIGNALHLGAGG